jgi:hypothetical protein
MTDDTSPIGHNSGDTPEVVDPLIERVQKTHAAIFDAPADFELERLALPKEVKTEDDATAVRAFVAKVQKAVRDAEKARKAEGEDYLRGKQKIDGAFNGVKSTLESLATKITERLTPYLRALEAAENARRAAEIEKARVEAAAQAAKEAEAREAEKAARDAEEAAQAAIRQANTDRERAAAQEAARAAGVAAQRAKDQAEAAQDAGIAADRVADTHAAVLAGGPGALTRTGGGGASSKLEEYWDWSISDMAMVRQQLGILGPHFLEGEVTKAVERAVNADLGHKVAGVRCQKLHRAKVASRTAPAKPDATTT